jgi:hypothetical protein
VHHLIAESLLTATLCVRDFASRHFVVTVMSAARLIRWIARASSLLAILWILFFAINSLLPSSDDPPLPRQESLALVLFPIGICTGLLLAWRRETLGGILSLAFLGSFCFWELRHHSIENPFLFLEVFFLPVAAPGL